MQPVAAISVATYVSLLLIITWSKAQVILAVVLFNNFHRLLRVHDVRRSANRNHTRTSHGSGGSRKGRESEGDAPHRHLAISPRKILTMFGKLLQPEAIFYLKCSKSGWQPDSPGSAGEACSAPQDPLAGFLGPLCGRERQKMEGQRGKREEGSPPTANSWICHCNSEHLYTQNIGYSYPRARQVQSGMPGSPDAVRAGASTWPTTAVSCPTALGALCGQLTFRLAWCRQHSAVMATELLQSRDLACGTLFQSSCVILTSSTDCSDDS